MAFLALSSLATGGAATGAAAAGAAAQGAAMGAAASATAAAAGSSAGLLGTLSSIYSAMSPIFTGLSLAAPFIAAGSTAALASQQMALANAQASLTEYQIKNMEQASVLRQSERKKKMRRAIGTQLALYGSSGVDPLQGTPVDVMGDTAAEFAYEDYADAFETQGRIYSNMIKARNQRAMGKQAAFGSLLDFGTRFAMRG
jgi:hypothetical protein